MKSKLRLAAILAIVLVVLGSLASWDEWQTRKEKDAENNRNRLVSFKPEDVVELEYFSNPETIENSDKSDGRLAAALPVEISAVKQGGGWQLLRPLQAPADISVIEALIKALTDYSYAKIITEDKSRWGDFGLAAPNRRIKLKIQGKAPAEITVFLGNKAPVGYEAYLRTSQRDSVLIGSQHLLLSTNKTLSDFRDKTLIKIDQAKVQSFSYHRLGEPLIELSQRDGKYFIVKPEQIDADSTSVRDFFDELNGIRIASFIDAPDEGTKALVNNPDVALSWINGPDSGITLKVVEHDGRLLAGIDPIERVYVLADDLKPKFKKGLVDFRNRRILESDLLDAKSIAIDGEKFLNIEGNWYSEGDAAKFDGKGKFNGSEKDKPRERSHIRALMVDLEFAKSDRFILPSDPIALSLTQAPVHRFVIGYSDQKKQLVTIDLYKIEGDADKYLVKRSGSSLVYRVPVSTFNSMTQPKPGEPAEAGGAVGMGVPMDDDRDEDLGSGADDGGVDTLGDKNAVPANQAG